MSDRDGSPSIATLRDANASSRLNHAGQRAHAGPLAGAVLEHHDGSEEAVEQLQHIVQDEYKRVVEAKVAEMRRAKLGLKEWDEQV